MGQRGIRLKQLLLNGTETLHVLVSNQKQTSLYRQKKAPGRFLRGPTSLPASPQRHHCYTEIDIPFLFSFNKTISPHKLLSASTCYRCMLDLPSYAHTPCISFSITGAIWMHNRISKGCSLAWVPLLLLARGTLGRYPEIRPHCGWQVLKEVLNHHQFTKNSDLRKLFPHPALWSWVTSDP